MSNYTTFTCSCRKCSFSVATRLPGILAPLAEPISYLRFFGHLVTKHRDVITMRTIWRTLVNLLWFLVALLLTIIRAALYVFYPLYMFLRMVYED